MSLKKDIAKLTKLDQGGKSQAKFKRLRGPGRAEQDLDMNNRPIRFRSGYNPSLFEDSLDAVEPCDLEYDEKVFDEIRRSVVEVRGTAASDDDIIQNIIKRQREAEQIKEKQKFSKPHSEESASTSVPSSDFSDGESASYKITENDTEEAVEEAGNNIDRRLLKNGVVRGLLNTRQISVSTLTNDTAALKLVEDSDDPDLLVHPLQAGRVQYAEELILERIGIKKTITPTDYLRNIGYSSFEFSKPRK